MTVKFKPIQWGKTSYGKPEAFTVAGVYRIYEAMNGGWTVVAGTRVLCDTDGLKNFPTIEAAQAAAQADLERCVLPAIDAEASERELEAVRAELKAAGHKHEGAPLHILVDQAIDRERQRIHDIRTAVDALARRAQEIYPLRHSLPSERLDALADDGEANG